MTAPLRCPSCDADLDAGPGLPFGELPGFGNAPLPRQSRVIAVYDEQRDRPLSWRCPDCSHEWDR